MEPPVTSLVWEVDTHTALRRIVFAVEKVTWQQNTNQKSAHLETVMSRFLDLDCMSHAVLNATSPSADKIRMEACPPSNQSCWV